MASVNKSYVDTEDMEMSSTESKMEVHHKYGYEEALEMTGKVLVTKMNQIFKLLQTYSVYI